MDNITENIPLSLSDEEMDKISGGTVSLFVYNKTEDVQAYRCFNPVIRDPIQFKSYALDGAVGCPEFIALSTGDTQSASSSTCENCFYFFRKLVNEQEATMMGVTGQLNHINYMNVYPK